MPQTIVTDIDLFYALISKHGEISIEEAEEMIEQERDLLVRWAKLLEENNFITLHYPMMYKHDGKLKCRIKL